jgi:hypothetical protein
VLVDVVAVLVVAVAVVDVIGVALVLDGLAAVTVRVRTVVGGVQLALLVLLTVVDVIGVVVVLDRGTPVARQVFMVQFLGMRIHENSSTRFSACSRLTQRQDRCAGLTLGAR